jgi:hypothetical protein
VPDFSAAGHGKMTVTDQSVKIRKQDKVFWMEREELQNASVRTTGYCHSATLNLTARGGWISGDTKGSLHLSHCVQFVCQQTIRMDSRNFLEDALCFLAFI